MKMINIKRYREFSNSVGKEIQRGILASNRTYFAARSLFRNKFLSRATKILIYKTLIRPIVAYGAETLMMTKKKLC
jgi:DNA-binding transcriptional MocR family regulator